MAHRWLHKILLVISLTLPLVAQADVTEAVARVDKNPAMLDEGVMLEVIVDDSVDSNAFDPSPLLKHFVVGRTSKSSQTSIVNGSMSQTTRWTTRLIAREPGQYTIPSFTIEGQQTQPIQLMVLPRSNAPAAQGRDVYLTTEVDVDDVYLQQQIHYRVRLYLAKELERGSLSTPQLDNADIRQVGEDEEFTEIVNGKRYRIIERHFAIIPQASGDFTIEAPIFEGEVVEGRHRSFAGFNTTKAISRVGDAIDISVHPIPDDFQGQWLPSDYVELREEWKPQNGPYTVGEPITRTLTLTAFGAVEEQLPKPESAYPEQVKTYPDQNSSTTIEKDSRLVAQRTDATAIVPTEPGEVTLPAVNVPWFNVVTGQMEMAQLPERTIMVAAADGSITDALPAEAQQTSEPDDGPSITAQPAPLSIATSSLWFYVALVFMLLWLITALLAWRWYRRPAPTAHRQTESTSHHASEAAAWKRLQAAFKQGKERTILSALEQWLRCYTRHAGPLNQQLQRVNNEHLTAMVEQLMNATYGHVQQSFDIKTLARQCQQLRRRSVKSKADNDLPPLQQIQ